MENIDEWIDSLRDSNKLVLVEGKKDKQKLEMLGIKNIMTISSKPLYKTIESVSELNKEIVILTDLDHEGRKLYSRIKHQCQRNGIRVDKKYREFLFSNTKITQIEGI